VFKVDNHIHHSAAMSAKHLLSFIKRKWTEESETSVL
jgi:AMP deaminase